MDKSLLDQLLEGDWLKLLNVKRYQTEAMLARASVADHTYMVTMICMMITDGMKDDFKYPDERAHISILYKAMLHDMEECIIGDIPRKQSTRDEVTIMKNALGFEIVRDIFDTEELKAYPYYFQGAKQNLTGLIVKYADMLAAYIEVVREFSLGNKTLKNVIMLAPQLLHEFVEDYNTADRTTDKEVVIYLRHLLWGVHEHSMEVLGHSYELDERV